MTQPPLERICLRHNEEKVVGEDALKERGTYPREAQEFHGVEAPKFIFNESNIPPTILINKNTRNSFLAS